MSEGPVPRSVGRSGWRIEERVATAGELHASWPSVLEEPSTRAVARCHTTNTAVVLGSTQPTDVVYRPAESGLEVVRRRSGGGAVLLAPEDPVWIDVWIPAGDPLWDADVTRAFGWLGATWAAALRRIGLEGTEVQGSGRGECTRWSGLVCFGGVGAGEVTIGGRKVVGLAQRRTRSGSWFHGACILRWDSRVLLGALALSDAERSLASTDLSAAVTGVAHEMEERRLGGGGGFDGDAPLTSALTALSLADLIVDAFVDSLPESNDSA